MKKEQTKCLICKKGVRAGKGLVIFQSQLLCMFCYNGVTEGYLTHKFLALVEKSRKAQQFIDSLEKS